MCELEIAVYDSLSAVETLWRDAEPGLELYPFQSLEWIRGWCEVTPDVKPQIAVVRRGGDILLILPFCIRRRLGLRQLTFLAADVSDYHAPLIAADFAAHCPPAAFARLYARLLSSLERFDYLHLRWMPEKVAATPNPLAQLAGVTPSLKAYGAELTSSFDAFLDRKRRKIHSDTQRQLRRLSEHGAVSLRRVSGAAEIEAVTAEMLAQKARRFTGQDGTSAAVNDARARRFYAGIGAIRTAEGGGHVSCLQVGKEIVATHVGFLHRKRFYYIMPGFDAARWGRFSPGRVLMEHLLRESIESGCTFFDMTIGDERYKFDWINTETRLFEWIAGASLAGKAFCAARAVARRAKSRLIAASPSIRSFVVAGRNSAGRQD